MAMAVCGFPGEPTGPRPDPRRFSDPGVGYLGEALAAAARQVGTPRGSSVAGSPPSSASRFFRQDDRGWIVDASLRRMIEFRRLNLVRPLPNLGTFDLILCRNFLIYLDDDTRRRLCRGPPSSPQSGWDPDDRRGRESLRRDRCVLDRMPREHRVYRKQ